MNPQLAKRSRHAATLLAFSTALFFSGCESALSDMEITDPSVLRTTFVAERALLNDGTVLNSLHATIFDRNLASVQIKNGHVKVNGQQMSMTEILNISTYYIPSATVDLNSNYTFEVVLPNGESYAGTVTTQDKAFTSLTVPTSGSVDSDLTISWQEVYVHDAMILSLGFTTPTGLVAGPSFNLTAAQMQAGSFVIPKSNFASPAGITNVSISLTGVKYGTIDSQFHSGSSTISRMRVEKNVAFN